MRFRAIIDKDRFAILYNHVKTLADIGKEAIVIMKTDGIRIAMVSEEDSMQLYSMLRVDDVFSEFRVESKIDNIIGLDLMLPTFLHALKSGHAAQTTTIKLSKRGASPFLSVLTQSVEGGVDVLQDLPVRVLAAAEVEKYAEPLVPTPTIKLHFPSIKALAQVLDRMKMVSKTLKIEADQAERTVMVGAKNETVAIRTFFRDLIPDTSDSALAGTACSVHVAVKHLARTLKAVAFHDARLVLCIVPSHAVILHMESLERSASITALLSLLDTGAADVEE